MSFTITQRVMALAVATILHLLMALFMINGSHDRGSTQSGEGGVQSISLMALPQIRAREVSAVDIEQAETIEAVEEVTAVEVVENLPQAVPKQVPKAVPQVKVQEKPLPRKEIKKPVVAAIDKVPDKKNSERSPAKSAAPSSADTSETGTGETSQAGQVASLRTGVVSDRGQSQDSITSYKAIIAALLQKHKRYPKRAEHRRQEGIAMLAFTVRKDGTVVDFKIKDSSGYGLLDKEVIAMLKRASPLPPFPQELHKESLTLIVPVEFSIR